ncbi:GNAT family N-acetyltransferase [Actinomadura kijaniata]|uniref:GNAT family N-acetyltransferase n=1 Tax=Actinomadura kijaniata TaxID=46161 RepID=UPI003F1DF6C4
MGIEITNNADAGRYEIRTDGELAGFAEYRLRGDGTAVFTHTEIDPRFEGRGLGGKLARGALDDVRGRGVKAVPVCPFIKGWIEKHPDYQDLVA